MTDTSRERCEADATLLREWADVLEIPSGDFVNTDLRQAADLILALLDRAEKVEKDRDAAIMALGDAARARGEAEGMLAASQWPGVVDGWKRRAEKAEASLAEAVEILRTLRQDMRAWETWRLVKKVDAFLAQHGGHCNERT